MIDYTNENIPRNRDIPDYPRLIRDLSTNSAALSAKDLLLEL